MNFTARQQELLEFVKRQHEGQLRKYDKAPYWTHLVSVAQIASDFEAHPFTVETALCHDLFEDTKCSEDELHDELIRLHYSAEEAAAIIQGVRHLTDHYTAASHAGLNRKARKEKERLRLSKTPPHIQSIKYADMIDNLPSIVTHDHGFGVVYLKEKLLLLDVMRKGNIFLLVKCGWVVQNAINALQPHGLAGRAEE